MQNEIMIFEVINNGLRLDVFCASKLNITRSQADRLISNGKVKVNEKDVLKSGCKLKQGQNVSVIIEEAKPSEVVAQDIPIDIIYEDNDIAVVYKPSGMVVHPAPGNSDGTMVNALLFKLNSLSGIGGIKRPGIVHRLDKDTSGLLVVAKNDKAHENLSMQMKERTTEKHYLALVLGKMKEIDGVIIKPISRHRTDRKKMGIDDKGRYAETHWKLVADLKNASLLDVRLITGRTHQIRVHMASIQRPVVGDVIYNVQEKKHDYRLMLHAFSLEITHPITGERMKFFKFPPESFIDVLKKLDITDKTLNEIYKLCNTDLEV